MQDEKDESFAHQWPWRDLGFWQAFPWLELVFISECWRYKHEELIPVHILKLRNSITQFILLNIIWVLYGFLRWRGIKNLQSHQMLFLLGSSSLCIQSYQSNCDVNTMCVIESDLLTIKVMFYVGFDFIKRFTLFNISVFESVI